MSHACKEPNCTNPPFNEYCRYHQFRLYMRGGRLYKSKPQVKSKIPRESKKRKLEGKTYKQTKDELRGEMIKAGTYNCFFCTKPMGNEKGFHHTHKRDGSYLTDRKFLKPGHNQCHVWDYHQATVEELLKRPWYKGFLLRLRELDEMLWRIEMNKQTKSINLFKEDEE